MPTSKPSTLSARQKELCEVIDDLTRERGFPPTLRECAAIMGVHWTRVARIAHDTVEKGAITHEPGIGRSWRTVETRG
jgi:SOS-response transcriptional repressor LexA